MDRGSVIVREAVPADLPLLAMFYRREFDALAIRHDVTEAHLGVRGQRIAVVLDGADIIAALTAVPIETVDGPGFEVVAFAVRHDHPDRVLALDTLCLFACSIAASERRQVIVSHHNTSVATVYGRDLLGMEAEPAGVYPDTGRVTVLRQQGTASAIIARILERRPAWRTSL